MMKAAYRWVTFVFLLTLATILGVRQGQGNFLVEIAGTAPGSGYGQLAVTENASLGGTLSVGLLGGFTPTPTDFFTILTAGDGLGGISEMHRQ